MVLITTIVAGIHTKVNVFLGYTEVVTPFREMLYRENMP